ncbi:MAG: protein kinase [Myxococcales bacterium]|nr:protein kinase [Myxococcales bacterium]
MLETRIGRGGMGEVWRARHQSERVAVAVKVLTAKGSSRPMFVKSFRNEVRAVATLEHPHIAMVLDYGAVPSKASEASKGRLVAGTPYLSMELVEGETLADHMGSLDWPEIARILTCLLDALAHAHARGVIHRDLKLSNVLYDAESGVMKLTDFGIAHAMAATGDPFRWGTPAYMPPEQLLGRWWEYGPWTDLYSLGCCAYALTTGKRAFSDDVDADTESRHLPPFEPKMPVPDGFDDWLRVLTAPAPERRFQLAADAGWALHRIAERPRRLAPTMPTEDDGPIREIERAKRNETTIALAFDPIDLDQLEALEAEPVAQPGEVPTQLPPMPARWRPIRAVERSTKLLGAGLGLYPVRRIPMVGRHAERTLLWNELKQVRASGRARLVWVHGPAGIGKTRLGTWLCERANEVGAATVMRGTYAPNPAAGDGLAGMLARYLRTGGLGPAQIRQRARAALQASGGRADVRDIQGTLEIIAPGSEGGQPFATPAERHGVVRRFVASQAHHRPVVLFADDAQWGMEALEFASSLMGTQEQAPVPALVVLCTRDESLAERAQERSLLEGLEAHEHTTRLTLAPLGPEEHRGLVEELLGLEGALARLVEERTAGNPMFAVQLVGDWVHRRILVPGRQGFQLREGAEVQLPDNLFAAWAGRIDAMLAKRSADDRQALEIAALLGQHVNAEQWHAACRARGIAPSDDLVDELLTRRLASADETEGWSFAHSMLRESLERQAEEAGRAQEHHRAVATMLQASGLPGEERLARHLVRAGALAQALGPAVDAIEAACRAGEFDRADGLLDVWQEAIGGLQLEPSDPRWVRGLTAAAAVHRYKDRPKAMLETCSMLDVGVREHGWPRELMAFVRMHQGRLARVSGKYAKAVELFRDGLQYVSADDPYTEATLHARIGQTLVSLAAFRGADAAFRRCLELATEHGDDVNAGDAWIGLGGIALSQGDLDEATRSAARARDSFRVARHRWGLATASEMFGEIARNRGSWDESIHCYRTSSGIWHALGTESAALTADFNIALVEIERGNGTKVAPTLEQLGARARSFGNRSLWATVRLAQLVADAETDDEGAWDRHMNDASTALTDTQFVSPDVATTAEIAGRAAAERGWDERANAAYELAIAQWMRLGREEDADRVRWSLP